MREQRRLHIIDGGARELVGDRPDAARIPLEPERRVHVHQHVSHQPGVPHHDDRREQPGAADDPLGGADQLGLAAGVDAEGPGAVLARDLADARVDAEVAQRLRLALRLGGKARVDVGHRVARGDDLVDDQALPVIGGGAAAR